MFKKIISNIKKRLQLASLVNSVKKSSKERKILLFQTPIHSNIGDHAITEAELSFLKENFNFPVFEVNDKFLEIFVRKFKTCVSSEDIIVLHGGGNFGNEYMPLELTRRLVVETFSKNKIVVFPQTIHYTDNSTGLKELNITKKIFSQHKNLTLTARENVSFELMKKYFPNNNIILTPDIVLSTSKEGSGLRKFGLEVIREDQESILNSSDKTIIHSLLSENFPQVLASDMHVDGFKTVQTPERRKIILEEKFNQFSSASLVITDRLHGMVFATITGTPCIVFSNYNQKVLGTYEWIKDLEYIKFVNNIEEAKQAFKELRSLKDYRRFDKALLKSKYLPLIKSING